MGQEVVEGTGHFVQLIVDDEWDGQGLAPVKYLCQQMLTMDKFCLLNMEVSSPPPGIPLAD